MRLLGILALSALGLVGSVVGARLLMLAHRTRQLPELWIGLGLVLITVGGAPLSSIGRLPTLVRTPVGDALFATGLLLALCGIELLFVFTWKVFRPAAGWARTLVVLAALALGAQFAGILYGSQLGQTLEQIVPHTRPWALGTVSTVALSFAWTAAEALPYHARLRRRLALGLADAVVVNRMLLWGVSGIAAAVLCAVLASTMLAGQAPLRDPLPLAVIGVAGTFASCTWYLAFLPPEAWLRFVRRRSEGAGA